MKPKRRTIDLRDDEVARLTDIAERCGAYARAGKNYNLPSWRAMIRDIAAGRCKVKGGGK